MIYIHQPNFLPWIGMIDALLNSDVFVVYDDVQYEDGGWQNRNKIIAKNSAQYITIPILKKFGQNINQVYISNNYDPDYIVKKLKLTYANTPFFEFSNDLFAIFLKNHTKLIDLNMDIIYWALNIFNKKIDVVLSSNIETPNLGKKERIFFVMNQMNEKKLYCGSGARNYLNDEDFNLMQLEVVWQKFEERHPVYEQKFNRNFIPNLSFIDMLFSTGPEMMKGQLLK